MIQLKFIQRSTDPAPNRDWVDTSVVDPLSGARTFSAEYRGVKSIRTTVQTPDAKRAIGLALILRELELIEGWLLLIQQKTQQFSSGFEAKVESVEDAVIVPALWRACLVTFTKSFHGGRGGALSGSDVSAIHKPLYAKLIGLRNKFAAHGDGSALLEFGEVGLYEVDFMGLKEKLVSIDTHQPAVDLSILPVFLTLVRNLREVASNKIGTTLEHLASNQ